MKTSFKKNQENHPSPSTGGELKNHPNPSTGGELRRDGLDLRNSPPMEGCPKDGVVESSFRNTFNYMILPFNPKLKERAKELRKAGNLSEVLFWNQVKKKQFFGLDFDRQKIIGNYIVDFYCANLNLVVEIDGGSHDDKVDYDTYRDEYLEGLGLTVIHFSDTDVRSNLDGVMIVLESFVKSRTTPAPPPEGNKEIPST